MPRSFSQDLELSRGDLVFLAGLLLTPGTFESLPNLAELHDTAPGVLLFDLEMVNISHNPPISKAMQIGTSGNLKLGGKLMIRIFVAMATVSIGSYFTSGAFGAPYYHPQVGGGLYTTAFTGIDQGFANITSIEAASTQPCTWASAGTCRTALTAGDSEYAFEVRLNTSPSSTKTYTVTVNWDNGGTGASVQMCQFLVTVPSTARTGQYMNFLCDTGVASISSPASVQVAFG